MRKRVSRVLLVTIGVVILVLSLGVTAAAAGNGAGGETVGVDGSGQQNGWQRGETAGNKLQSSDCTGSCEGILQQNRWQQNMAKGNRQQSGNCNCTASTAEVTPLSEDETYWLTYMREEEKLARDVYRVLYDQWGVTIFNNIAASEQKHMDAIEKLLGKYGINDPVTDEDVLDNFTILELNTLYDELKTRGLSSLDEAYQVGVDIEKLDIEDLEDAIRVSGTHPDIVRVYNNLLDGSENHLAAFELHLD